MRAKGTLKSWNDDKGFGFISPFNNKKIVFVHITAFENQGRRPVVNDVITYTLSTGVDGKTQAIKANIAGIAKTRKTKQSSSFSGLLTILFLICLVIAVLIFAFPLQIFLAYLMLSVITFLIYAHDKSAANKGAWRTSESTLHLFAIVGGWPGAMVAQSRLRHKSKKQSFIIVFWVTVIVNCSVLTWLLSPKGEKALAFITTVFTLN